MNLISPRPLIAAGCLLCTLFGSLLWFFNDRQESSRPSTEHRPSVQNDPDIGFGALIPDPDGIIDLPAGFSYQLISIIGETMDDGFFVPGKHDAMGAFPYINDDGSIDPDRTILIRNHEIEAAHKTTGPFVTQALIDAIDPAKLYDPGTDGPSRGGTTTLVYNTKDQKLEGHWLSLAGTERNCAGGVSLHNSWLSCEETAATKGKRLTQDHGYVFEVPATNTPSLANPVPIKAMGRFMHEACCVDPNTGIVYMTEDRSDGLMYRFIPNDPADLLAGGRLEALSIDSMPSFDTRNWTKNRVSVGQKLRSKWIPMDDVESPKDDLRDRGFKLGATRFARGEGMWWSDGHIYFVATSGGRAHAGQIWRLTPSADRLDDILELFLEPNDPSIFNHGDNITVSPWGDMIVCEDENKPPHLIGVTMEGELYRLARNAKSNSEFAGAVFSPDGSTLFVNMQGHGWTLAITGPWKE